MSSHSTCMAVTLAFSSTCNVIPRNSMIMQGIPIAFPWQTPGLWLCLSSLCGIRQARPSKRTGVRLAVPLRYLRLLRCLFSMGQLAVAWVWRRIYEGSERRDQPWECHGRIEAGLYPLSHEPSFAVGLVILTRVQSYWALPLGICP